MGLERGRDREWGDVAGGGGGWDRDGSWVTGRENRDTDGGGHNRRTGIERERRTAMGGETQSLRGGRENSRKGLKGERRDRERNTWQ